MKKNNITRELKVTKKRITNKEAGFVQKTTYYKPIVYGAEINKRFLFESSKFKNKKENSKNYQYEIVKNHKHPDQTYYNYNCYNFPNIDQRNNLNRQKSDNYQFPYIKKKDYYYANLRDNGISNKCRKINKVPEKNKNIYEIKEYEEESETLQETTNNIPKKIKINAIKNNKNEEIKYKNNNKFTNNKDFINCSNILKNEVKKQRDAISTNKELISKNLNYKENNKEIQFNNYTRKPKGLYNFALNCYMNATLQCLYCINELRYFFLENSFSEIKQEICFALKKVMEGLSNEAGYFYSAENFKEIIGNNCDIFKGCDGGDSTDLLNFLFDTIHNELSNNSDEDSNDSDSTIKIKIDESDQLAKFRECQNGIEKSIVNDLFNTFYKTSFQCNKKSKHIKYSFQGDIVTSFNLPPIYEKFKTKGKNYITITDCFDFENSYEDKVNSYCTKCDKKQFGIRKRNIFRPPKIFVIVLERGYKNNINVPIKIEQKLNLEKYIEENDSKKNSIYNLIGVCTHLGSNSITGHYIAYCLHGDKYYCFDDTRVSQANEKDIQNGDPYVLFYQNIENKKTNDQKNATFPKNVKRTKNQNLYENLKAKLNKYLSSTETHDKYKVDYYDEERQDPFHWLVLLKGPKQSPYYGKHFILKIYFPEDYPKSSIIPSFETPIYHLNVDEKNNFLIKCNPNLLKGDIEKVLNNLYSLIKNPDVNYSVSQGKKLFFTNFYNEYIEKAKNYTYKHGLEDSFIE